MRTAHRPDTKQCCAFSVTFEIALFSVLLKKSFIHMIKYVFRKKVYKGDGSFKGSRNCEKSGREDGAKRKTQSQVTNCNN